MKLSLDQLQVTSFEPAPRSLSEIQVTTTGGEDCFSGFACLTITRPE